MIGCGAGPACTGFVVVTHDALGYSQHVPRFVPRVGDVAAAQRQAFEKYVSQVVGGEYPARQHAYEMLPGEAEKLQRLQVQTHTQGVPTPR